MTKEEYLAAHEVQAFAAWLGANLDNSTFAHQYALRKSNKHWSCTSLGDAFPAPEKLPALGFRTKKGLKTPPTPPRQRRKRHKTATSRTTKENKRNLVNHEDQDSHQTTGLQPA